MSRLFLLTESIDTMDKDLFLSGINTLICIEKKPEHIYCKHDSVYNLPIWEEFIYPNFNSQDSQEVYRFIEQMSIYDYCYINTEEAANTYCKSTFNGFLGFIHNEIIQEGKQIDNNEKYKKWIYDFSIDKESLLEKTYISPERKESKFTDHHGKDVLTAFWKKLRNCPYVISASTAAFGAKGKIFIRNIYDNGDMEIVLNDTQKEYALLVKTTGRNIEETKIISEILLSEYK